MKPIILLIIGIVFSLSLKSQNEYLLLWDEDGSPITSAETLITVRKGLSDFGSQYLKRAYWKEETWKGKSLGIGYRFLKSFLIDAQLDYLIVALQHEAFGHGARYREFGLRGNSFHISLAPPYGPGGASARPNQSVNNRQFGVHESVSRITGGVEGASIIAKSLRYKWLLKEEINYNESILYLMSFHNNTAYILATKLFDTGGDIQTFLRRVNAAYGFDTKDSYQLTLNEISFQSTINLLNTHQLLAAYTYLKVYLFDGKEIFNIPMIKLGNTKWLPAVRMGLTPFGSEFMFENHFLKNNDLLEVSLRLGDNSLANYWGGGIRIRKKIKELLIVQAKVDFWNQPEMELGGQSTFYSKEGLGGRATGSFNWQFGKDFPVGLYSEIGYKTTGFIEGEQLDKGPILRIGLSLYH